MKTSDVVRKHIRDTAVTAPDVVPARGAANPAVTSVKSPKESVANDSVESHREEELLAGFSTRVVDGERRKENLRVEFNHVTAADDERPIKRSERTPIEIAADTRAAIAVGRSVILGQRCERHGTPDCKPCRLLDESLRNASITNRKKKPKQKLPLHPQQVQTIPVTRLGDADVARLRAEWQGKESSTERKRRQAEAATLVDEKRREQTKKVQVHVVQSIRLDHGYDARDLAKLLMRPGFNEATISVDYMNAVASKRISRYHEQVLRGTRKRFPKTLADLETLLPPKFETMFSDEQIRFYRDHISGNYTKTEMQDRIRSGLYRPLFIDDDTLLELENAIIRRAWDLRLLAPKPCTRVADFDQEIEAGHDAEAKSEKAGDTTVKSGYGSTPGKMWKPKPSNTFDRGPIHTKHFGVGGSDDAGGATAQDSYDEESGA
jgi:hypothetical protein